MWRLIDLGFNVHHKARVRLLGIDTPESRTRNLEEKKLGKAASARLKELLKMGKIRMECSKEKGKFGRILGRLYVEDRKKVEPDFCANDRLCEEGHARPYFGGKKVPWL